MMVGLVAVGAGEVEIIDMVIDGAIVIGVWVSGRV